MVKLRSVLKWLFIGLVLLFIYAPIILLTVYSFNAGNSIKEWVRFSLEHYRYFFNFNHEPFRIVIQTLILAAVVATLSTLLGTIGAIGIYYSKKHVASTLSVINQIPVINAEVVTAISFALFVTILGLNDGESFLPLVLGQVMLCTPFVVLSVMPKLKQMDNNLYEAALDLGATPTKALFSAVIPQIIPGIISGFLLAVTLSLDDYIIAAYTKPETFQTISTHIYGLTKGKQVETIKSSYWAFTAVVFLCIILLVIFLNLRAAKREKEKNK